MILAILGIAVVVGIYLWERRKRQAARVQAIRKAQEAARDRADGGIERELRHLDRLVAERGPERPARKPESRRRQPGHRGPEGPPPPAPQGELALGEEAYWMDLPDSVPFKIVQINVVARGSWFRGARLETACREVELVPGDMNIFHRFEQAGKKSRVLFSLANMVEPGHFPLDDMAGLSTPGVTLFAQFPGPRDSLATFSDMLFTAERLAAMLDAELQDETHSALTRQTIEHIREEILEHRRQIQLARKKKT
ncbi:MAG: cell division protein ZipA [Chromatiales bacterium]